MKDGQNYSPEFQMEKAVEPGQFVFAAAYFDHGHIYGQIGNLAQTGATLGYIYDTDPSGQRIKQVTERFPDAKVVSDFNEILKAPEVQLVTSAAIPSERCAVGLQVLEADKDYFTDKSPFTTLDQLEQARRKVEATGRRYMVSFSERLQTEAGWHAGELVKSGAIGSPLQILILAPHRLSKATRPDWFFDKEKYGGILTDIGSHQFEQFLTYAGASDASINFARVENFANADKPGLEDFGEASLTMNNGVSCYCRVDWFTPDGSETWGDGRTFILGTEGYLEVRKYIDFQRGSGSKIYLCNQQGQEIIDCEGKVGAPFFPVFVRDLIDRTENAMTQEHAFKAAELSMLAQKMADEQRKDAS